MATFLTYLPRKYIFVAIVMINATFTGSGLHPTLLAFCTCSCLVPVNFEAIKEAADWLASCTPSASLRTVKKTPGL